MNTIDFRVHVSTISFSFPMLHFTLLITYCAVPTCTEPNCFRFCSTFIVLTRLNLTFLVFLYRPHFCINYICGDCHVCSVCGFTRGISDHHSLQTIVNYVQLIKLIISMLHLFSLHYKEHGITR